MRKLFDHGRHQRARASGPRVLLEIIELADEITRRTPGNSGNRSNALQIRAMADSARCGDARAAGFGESLAFSEASFRRVSNELRTRIAVFELRGIDRHLDDAL